MVTIVYLIHIFKNCINNLKKVVDINIVEYLDPKNKIVNIQIKIKKQSFSFKNLLNKTGEN